MKIEQLPSRADEGFQCIGVTYRRRFRPVEQIVETGKRLALALALERLPSWATGCMADASFA
jgi:hypothetical protein